MVEKKEKKNLQKRNYELYKTSKSEIMKIRVIELANFTLTTIVLIF
jgi:hypothetical protein